MSCFDYTNGLASAPYLSWSGEAAHSYSLKMAICGKSVQALVVGYLAVPK